MKIIEKNPPRLFRVGKNEHITLKDCANITLEADEQITLVTAEEKEFDIARKTWGFYATPSVNGRLKSFGLKSALVESTGKYFILIVDTDQQKEFEIYLKGENMVLICWLDDEVVLAKIKKAMMG